MITFEMSNLSLCKKVVRQKIEYPENETLLG